MTDLSLDDQFKKSEIEKNLAEANKFQHEARAAARQSRGAVWSETIKLIGGLILGLGGVVAAWTQYEVAELKARSAKQDLEATQKAKGDADAALKGAEAKLVAAEVNLRHAEKLKATADKAAKQSFSEKRTAEVATARLQNNIVAVSAELQESQLQLERIRAALQKESIAGLKPEAAALATKLIEAAKAKDINLKVVSGYRSAEQQEELVIKGLRKTKWSTHNTGFAFDVVIVDDGKTEARNLYSTVGEIGKTLGLVWGGDWSFRDPAHFETKGAKKALVRLKKGAVDDV